MLGVIIFGFRRYLSQLAMLTLVCGHCNNPCAHPLRKAVTKFTLFFVPLFPVRVVYSVQCTFCGTTAQFGRQRADELMKQAPSGGGSLPLPR
ncbi:zinc ribbon domain-containing protein [Pseudonocardia spinosispora]|uniref:zinc ribbon domain-containing protein n=1 Tax=Pseudonocardia spinosispora TaxID=103441 RepID=UPI0004011259|nr:zinc ribbon domain-containing protein [Pseudonocardia spinosispora]